ncbi:MAG: spore germination protein [Christensenellales bacterium]
MEDDPISLSADLAGNIGVFRDRFGASGNADIIIRRFRSGAFISALMTIDGMTDTREIDENILKPCMALPPDAGEDAPAESRVDYLIENVVSVLPTEMKSNFDDLLADALSGQSVLLCDGCAAACVMDTRGFESAPSADRRQSRLCSARTKASANPSEPTSPASAHCAARRADDDFSPSAAR